MTKQFELLYKGLLIAKKKIVFLEYDCAYLRKAPFNFDLHHCKMHRTINDVKNDIGRMVTMPTF